MCIVLTCIEKGLVGRGTRGCEQSWQVPWSKGPNEEGSTQRGWSYGCRIVSVVAVVAFSRWVGEKKVFGLVMDRRRGGERRQGWETADTGG